MNEYVFDIETNGLLESLDTIHCLVIKDINTKQNYSFKPNQVAEGLELLKEADTLIGHNILKFDIPAIQKIYPEFKTKGNHLDTIVLSRLVWPDIKDLDFKKVSLDKNFPSKMIGRHSLESWGYRLNYLKGDYGKQNDWSQWSEDMQTYCERDVDLNAKLYEVIKNKNFSDKAINLEHEFQRCILRQETHGFCFDKDKAIKLSNQLEKRRGELYNELQELFPQWEKDIGIFIPKRDNKTKGYVAGQPITKRKTVIFNPNSNDHIADRLKNKYNWKPKEFTKEGRPRVDETVLASLKYSEAKQLAEYKLIQKRLGQLAEGDNAWLKCLVNGKIHGSVITNGTVTGRCTHKNPNIAQVPSVTAQYGNECRSLFVCPEGYKLVGVDLSQLELRCLAHYLYPFDKGAMVKELLEGDIHTANQKAAGLPNRASAKTFIYALIYGAGDKKIGEIVGGNTKDGKDIKRKFFSKNKAFARFKEDVERVVETKGKLTALDGRKIPVRSKHSAVNFLLQSCGSILVKTSTILLHSRIDWEQWQDKVNMVAHVHDEMQFQVKEELADKLGQAAIKAIKESKFIYNFNCPLDGEYKVGQSWSETH
jgi:DNA polymerase I-like protein with 3'-5' exonuclease and polymerase domains